MSNAKKLERAESIKTLRKWISPGRKPTREKPAKVYTILRHVSRSGMSREISILVINGRGKDRRILTLDWHAARALGWRVGKRGVKVSGCGMDMGFHLVYSLASVIYGEGYAVRQEWI